MSKHTAPRRDQTRLSRRAFVATGTAGVAAVAGCIGGDDGNENGTDSGESNSQSGVPAEIPYIEDPPDAVYMPTHREPFAMQSVVEAGDYALLPHFSYPHRFWLVDGGETEEVLPTIDDSLHLMVAFWDRKTGKQLPVDAGATLSVSRDGDTEKTVAPWPMLAQTMGFHFGDNVPLPADGTYTVEATVNPIEGVRKTGAFEGRFEETATATFEFEWSTERRRRMVDNIEYLDEERWGEPGALDPMQMNMGNMPPPSLPSAGEYPGMDLGVHESDDARFVVRYLEDSRLAADDEGYLLVSPRTPYNRLPLPDMSLSLSRSGGEATLTQTLDGELGVHYGSSVALSPGEQFDIVVDGPPQIARHRGYETAFLDMPPVTVEVME